MQWGQARNISNSKQMMAAARTYPAKILLFGEYSLIHGSAALTLPLKSKYVQLLFPTASLSAGEMRTARNSNVQLRLFYTYLQKMYGEQCGHFAFDRMATDLDNGLYLWSNIPSGYGLGSSGALVAAIYDQYMREQPGAEDQEKAGVERMTPGKLDTLKRTFADMEAFFHGESSGLDPLSSFVKEPLLLAPQQGISTAPKNILSPNTKGGFFLLDTKRHRNTKPLVSLFNEKCLDPAFINMLESAYIPLNDACINAVLQENDKLLEHLHRLSSLQLKHFKEMIPDEFSATWAHGLASGKYVLKLCGAGGGGFLLGYTEDYTHVSQEIATPKERIIILNDHL